MKHSKPKSSGKSSLKRGRPAGRPEPDKTVGSGKILETIIELLRHNEPTSISVQEVAKAAGVDPALVRYYFGGKHGLLIAAASRLATELQESAAAILRGKGTTVERLRRRIETLIEMMRKNPRFHRLLLDYVYQSKDAAGRTLLENIGHQGLTLTTDFLLTGQERGELREVDPRLLHLAIIGMCEFFVASGPLQEVLFRDSMKQAASASRFAEFICDLLLNGLQRRDRKAVQATPLTVA